VRSGGSVYESPESTKTSSGEYSARIGKSQLFLLVPWNWLSNNIVKELDVTKLKLTLKNLINHRSSATSGDDKLSCDHSGVTSPRLPVTAIEDVQKTAENNSQLQLERDSDYYFNRRENINKENDKLLHLTIEKTHVPRGSSDEADDKYSTTKHERDKQVQAVNTKDRLST
jgi:hypothetical protein